MMQRESDGMMQRESDGMMQRESDGMMQNESDGMMREWYDAHTALSDLAQPCPYVQLHDKEVSGRRHDGVIGLEVCAVVKEAHRLVVRVCGCLTDCGGAPRVCRGKRKRTQKREWVHQ